ncbi:MAG TPA: GNAT family protein [Pyrinomonadaceae bacterium]|nr:GNAT family protein [Pyrinomonadaceae bacterium]
MDAWEVDSFQIDDEVMLRRFRKDDVADVFRTVHRNSEHLIEFMHWMSPDYSLESAREFIEGATKTVSKSGSLGFGIFRSQQLIGSIGFVYFDELAEKTEIGYWIDREEQGKGIVSKACRKLIDWAFEDLNLNRIEIRCSSLNKRSSAIPERFGFKLEGHLRESEYRNGKLHDFLIFGLLRSEWRSRDRA